MNIFKRKHLKKEWKELAITALFSLPENEYKYIFSAKFIRYACRKIRKLVS